MKSRELIHYLACGMILILAAPVAGQNLFVYDFPDFLDPRNLSISFGEETPIISRYFKSSVTTGVLFDTKLNSEAPDSSKDTLVVFLKNPFASIRSKSNRLDFVRFSNTFHFSVFQANAKLIVLHNPRVSQEFRTITQLQFAYYGVPKEKEEGSARLLFSWNVADTPKRMEQELNLIFDLQILPDKVSSEWGYSKFGYYYQPRINRHIITHSQQHYLITNPNGFALRFGFTLSYGGIGSTWGWGSIFTELASEIPLSFLNSGKLYLSVSPYFPQSNKKSYLQLGTFIEIPLARGFF